MRKNYYGRRRWNSKEKTNNSNNHTVTVTTSYNKSAFAKYKELSDKASRTVDPIDKINLQQSAEHWLKMSKEN
tara:strand:+ start:6296 stop:6514 length:219 start_codon:yes stop_codon:yes gene_type:complete